MYLMTLNMTLSEILDQFLVSLANVLNAKRQKEILEEAKVRKKTSRKVGASLTHEEKVQLSQMQT